MKLCFLSTKSLVILAKIKYTIYVFFFNKFAVLIPIPFIWYLYLIINILYHSCFIYITMTQNKKEEIKKNYCSIIQRNKRNGYINVNVLLKILNDIDQINFLLDEFINLDDELLKFYKRIKLSKLNLNPDLNIIKKFCKFNYSGGETDLNPGKSCLAGFQDRCFQPLSHLSIVIVFYDY